MGDFKNKEEATEFFKDDLFAVSNGITIDELTDDGCVCSMIIKPEHRNAMGGVMGGAIFTLADFASAVSSNNDHLKTVGLNASINYLSTSKGTKLIATAYKEKNGRNTAVYRVSVKDDLGKDIALFVGTGYKLD